MSDRLAQTLNARDYKGAGNFRNGSIQACQLINGVMRYLTNTERERLMGFPVGFTDIPYKSSTNRPRTESLGNSMVVPVMRWIGERITLVDQLL